MPNEIIVKQLNVKKDERGWLAEIVTKEDVPNPFGLILVTTAYPGKTKGNHYHKRKSEWYCVVQGNGLLAITDLASKKKTEIRIGKNNMALVKIPPNYLHSITNIGQEEMILISYVDESFNEKDPDTYYLKK